MNRNNRAAIAMGLMEATPATLAAELGIPVTVIKKEMAHPELRGRIADEIDQREETARRLLSTVKCEAAAELVRYVLLKPDKPDAKVLLDILKAAGALETTGNEQDDGWTAVMSRLEEAIGDGESG